MNYFLNIQIYNFKYIKLLELKKKLITVFIFIFKNCLKPFNIKIDMF